MTPGLSYNLQQVGDARKTASVVGTAIPELVFTATIDAAQWVPIYGLLRLTDANDDWYILYK